VNRGDVPATPHFSPELESKLEHSAANQSRDPEVLVQDVLSRYFEEEARALSKR
jgi:hypothetical protein